MFGTFRDEEFPWRNGDEGRSTETGFGPCELGVRLRLTERAIGCVPDFPFNLETAVQTADGRRFKGVNGRDCGLTQQVRNSLGQAVPNSLWNPRCSSVSTTVFRESALAPFKAVEDYRSPRPGGFRREDDGVATASWSAPVLWRFASGIPFNPSTLQLFNPSTAVSKLKHRPTAEPRERGTPYRMTDEALSNHASGSCFHAFQIHSIPGVVAVKEQHQVRSPKPSSERGLTLLEVLGVILILAVLAMVLIPAISRPVSRVPRVRCVNNLKNIGLAFRIFSTDHGGQWPMDRSITNQGTREWLADDTQLWRHWLQLSNELSDPTMLLCPSDLQRQPKQPFFSAPRPLTWAGFTNTAHLSYFLGLNAREESYQTILSGDRNLTTNGFPVRPGRLIVNESTVVGFSTELHAEGGSILMADGSVQQVSDRRANEAWRANLNASGLKTNLWLVP